MDGGPEVPGAARGEDLARGEAPVPWGAASEPDVLEEVVRRLTSYGEATVRLDGYTPFPLDYPAFRVEMERVARALPAPAEVDGEKFTYVFAGTSSDFSDPARRAANARLRRDFLDWLASLVGAGDVDISVNAPAGVRPDGDAVPPGTRVVIRAGDRAIRFVVEQRSVEEIAWQTGRGSTVLTEGVALDGAGVEQLRQRTREFLFPGA